MTTLSDSFTVPPRRVAKGTVVHAPTPAHMPTATSQYELSSIPATLHAVFGESITRTYQRLRRCTRAYGLKLCRRHVLRVRVHKAVRAHIYILHVAFDHDAYGRAVVLSA